MTKEQRLKVFQFKMLLRKMNTDVIESLLHVLESDWQQVLMKLELGRRN